jgi:hypothetical protein
MFSNTNSFVCKVIEIMTKSFLLLNKRYWYVFYKSLIKNTIDLRNISGLIQSIIVLIQWCSAP